ncbi:MAG: FeoA family protein [Candidatus Njordarchaeales archaeon]
MRITRDLSSLPTGTRGRIVSINGGWGARQRLYEMGVYPGVEIVVVENRGVGPIIVESKGGKIAIGRGLARKILVEVLSS